MANETIVVTGAARPGYGEAITRRLLREGMSVYGTYAPEDSEQAKTLSKELALTGRLSLIECDLSDRKALKKFIAGIDFSLLGIVNAQFFFELEDPDNFDHDIWDRSLAVNLSAPNFLAHELKNKMKDGGSIVVITSTEGFMGSFGASAYAATKAAIHNLVKSLANNFGKQNIRVNAIAAGWIGGVMDTDDIFNMSRRITPLERLGTPEEIAAVAYFLISKESSFITGSVITADGGYTGVDTISKYEFEQSRKQ